MQTLCELRGLCDGARRCPAVVRPAPPPKRSQWADLVIGSCKNLANMMVLVGNKYSITNESRTKTARLFFAQGCELEAMQMEGGEQR